MKTFFTILMMMLIVSVSFAQVNYYTVVTKDSLSYQDDDKYSSNIRKKYVSIIKTKKPKFLNIGKYGKLKWENVSSINYRGRNGNLIDNINKYAPAHVNKNLTYYDIKYVKAEKKSFNNLTTDDKLTYLMDDVNRIKERHKHGNAVALIGWGVTIVGGFILRNNIEDVYDENYGRGLGVICIGSTATLVGLLMK